MNKKNVAVVMGGFSDEYIVSLKSAVSLFLMNWTEICTMFIGFMF